MESRRSRPLKTRTPTTPGRSRSQGRSSVWAPDGGRRERLEWNDRYLELARERRAWQAVGAAGLALSLVLAGGLVWVSLQHKTVPYVVEVDSLGAALAIRPAETGEHPADERIVRYQLAA